MIHIFKVSVSVYVGPYSLIDAFKSADTPASQKFRTFEVNKSLAVLQVESLARLSRRVACHLPRFVTPSPPLFRFSSLHRKWWESCFSLGCLVRALWRRPTMLRGVKSREKTFFPRCSSGQVSSHSLRRTALMAVVKGTFMISRRSLTSSACLKSGPRLEFSQRWTDCIPVSARLTTWWRRCAAHCTSTLAAAAARLSDGSASCAKTTCAACWTNRLSYAESWTSAASSWLRSETLQNSCKCWLALTGSVSLYRELSNCYRDCNHYVASWVLSLKL